MDCSLVVPIIPTEDTMLTNFAEKTFVNSHKTLKFVFSLESFSLYGKLKIMILTHFNLLQGITLPLLTSDTP